MSSDGTDEIGPRPATTAITAGRGANGTSLAPPLWASSTWVSSGLVDARRRATGQRSAEFYGRYGNPTVRAFEEAIAALENAEDALAYGSGMGAVTTTILALCGAGSHIVAQRQLYAGTLAFLQGPCRRFGIDVTVVDGTKPGELAAAVQPGKTMMVLAETPSNPLLELVDLDELGAIKGPFTVVDSTFATPLGQQPLAHGVDLVIHSATKGIAGHNDATLGVIAGERDLLNEIWGYGVLHGATASPADALNALRGVRTMAVRINHQAASALQLAKELCADPNVKAVHYPGLPSHPQYDLAQRQMRHNGTVLAVELAGGLEHATAFLDSVRLARVATSLGGPETLVCHPATTTHASLTPDEQVVAGISPGLLRVSIGLEDPNDLVADFQHALRSRP
ncbi:MAG TPA: aminotransferase class I/II-fold pyridoxal phosphate-dependent enzyme [Ilumatobacteraceae bacterium]